MLKLQYFAGILFLLAIVVVAVQFTLYHRLTSVLKTHHSATWESLGSPSLVTRNSMHSALTMQRFLLRGDYRSLGDPAVTRLGRSAAVVTLAGYAIFIVLLAAVLILILKNPQAPPS